MAEWGFRVWDAAGNVRLDITDSITRYLGSIASGTANGSFYDARLLDGIPWSVANSGAENSLWILPVFTISGGLISWSFDPLWTVSSRRSATLYYGLR